MHRPGLLRDEIIRYQANWNESWLLGRLGLLLVQHALDQRPGPIVIADFNNDGRPDVATLTATNAIVLLNRCTP